MKLIHTLAPVALILFSAALLANSACGILTAPVTVPLAISENANFHLDFHVVDPAGSPIPDVKLTQVLQHTFWDPITSSTQTHEEKARIINGHTSVSERGRTLSLTFSHDGFYDTHLDINATDATSYIIENQKHPITHDIAITLIPTLPTSK